MDNQVYVTDIAGMHDFYVLRVKDMPAFRRIDKILNTEQLGTILEEDNLKNAEEVGEIVDTPGRRHFGKSEAELMNRNTAVQLKDEVGGYIGGHSEEGRIDFEEEHKELFTSTPLLQEFKSGPVFIGTNPGTSRRARLTILPQLCASPDVVTVRFLDFGNTATVTKDSITPRPAFLKSSRPLAMRCALFGCWSRGGLKRRTAFAQLVMGRSLQLEVMEVKGGVRQVDLCFLEGEKMTSVRDLMVFLDHANFSAPLSLPTISAPEKQLIDVEARKFRQLPQLKKGKVYRVLVSHVDNTQVHVQLLSKKAEKFTLLLPDLMDQLVETYGVRKCEEMWSLGTDRPGTPCAVKDVDGRWYRARLEKVIRCRIVRVTFVDFGNSMVVSLHKLRRLFSRFLRLPAIALPVTLMLEGRCTRSAAEVKSILGNQEVDLEVVGDEGEVKLVMEDFVLNDWMVGQA